MSFYNKKGPRGRFGFFPLIAAAMLLGLGAIVMFLWNAILPDLLQARRIGYWQAVGLLALCRILFGSFGRGRMGGPGTHGPRGRGQWRDKWVQMTPEERQQFKQHWEHRCRDQRGRRPHTDDTNDMK